ncbi:hypothetical protein ABB37_02343 [Leptomonas pyrrhocoris]|uniref:THIF-type NAD/FAD binding fold domain-containing protein n=1 Tax=Leptomonas pyrrhocoris TaxID=157538 RepID=A0A0M9G818_LEPPY|nr:hypothetical protein ABB37_02343 [Leptomonas pyrrhocoris]KPA84339.1 hypothetical protein ABB37_02343 [Leptomonas pyrrhocoris]|eukprot:XP_015662778.1 hypothetical protein ABB37_02343 [Leptomonas pyrrhocoris]
MAASATLHLHNVIGGNVKQARFDRQLRLWGTDGQAALEAAHVVAVGATPAIAEALKSLVLTGVTTVTLVDERTVTAEDPATNYFVPAASVGNSLATAVLTSVCALGEQCTGISAAVAPEAWVNAYVGAVEQDWQAGSLHSAVSSAEMKAPLFCEPSGTLDEEMTEDVSALRKFVQRFPVVVAGDVSASSSSSLVQIPSPSLILVSERYTDLSPTSSLVQTCLHRCYPDVPVVLVRSSGLLGFLQVYCPPRVIISPHNPTQVKMDDLRIFQPFPALKAWFDAHNPDDGTQFPTGDVDAMSLHSHLPYPCILYHAFRRWWSFLSAKEQTELQCHTSCAASSSPSLFPLSSKSYHDIANVTAGLIRRQSPPEEAFLEAMEKCTAKLNRPVVQQLPEGLHTLFNDPHCADPLLAVAEVQARLFPVAQADGTSAVPLTAASALLLQLWTRPEVLVWFVLRAVQLFVHGEIGCGEQSVESAEPSNHGNEEAPLRATPLPPSSFSPYTLPFSGYLPDFTTTTMWYRELQDIYHAKHQEDVACIADAAWGMVLQAVEATIAGTDDEVDSTKTPPPVLLHEQLSRAVRPLLIKLTSTMVTNIWDLRSVAFSVDYLATEESAWRQRLGRRLLWITHHIVYDMEGNASARRAACMAVAYLCKEELQRSAAAEHRVTGQEIAAEAGHLALLANTSNPEAENAATATTGSAEGSRAWLVENATTDTLFAKACEEVARWNGNGAGASVQLPSVAASTGALAAQEAVKLIMRIRVPCGRPMMYDGYTNKIYTL